MKKKLFVLAILILSFYLVVYQGYKLVHFYYSSKTTEKEFAENEKKYWSLAVNDGSKISKKRENLWLWFSVRGRAIDDDAYCDGNYEIEKWRQIFDYWQK